MCELDNSKLIEEFLKANAEYQEKRKLAIEANRKRREILKEIYSKGASTYAIAEKTGFSKSQIHRLISYK